MFQNLDEKKIYCPYCGESIAVLIDASVPDQHYVEDCSVCCRPIELRVFVEDGFSSVDARADNE